MIALTPRQLDYLVRRASGDTIDAIAQDTGLSPHTLKNHGTKAFARLGVAGLVEAYVRLGWLAPTQVGSGDFSRWLDQRLSARRLSYRLLSKMSGVDHADILRIRRGRRPSLVVADRLMRALGERYAIGGRS